MRLFKIPYDMKHEEKIFGGYLSIRQVIYLMLTIASFGLFAIPINLILKISIVAIIATFLLLCTFMKVGEQSFDKLFFYALKYSYRKRKFLYERCKK